MTDYEDVCALVPSRNEAATVADVIDGLYDVAIGHILVVHGHPKDDSLDELTTAIDTDLGQLSIPRASNYF